MVRAGDAIMEFSQREVRLSESPLSGNRPTTISYREAGSGESALLFLHGGWGYEIYPIDAQAQRLASCHRILIPDRSGYGRSSPIDALPLDFHCRAMLESLLFLDALGIDRAVWWGHSDGAIIAALAAVERPDRVAAVILEALHLYARKPSSAWFFEQMAVEPDTFGSRIADTLIRDHGERWRQVLRLEGDAWLGLAAAAASPHHDLFDGRLEELQPPAMLVHGGRDPRTEPGEFETIRAALPGAWLQHLPAAGHCPHAESATAGVVGEAMMEFLAVSCPRPSSKPPAGSDAVSSTIP
jgi:pimeloyl-ACP methyl ester carboxylesterase